MFLDACFVDQGRLVSTLSSDAVRLTFGSDAGGVQACIGPHVRMRIWVLQERKWQRASFGRKLEGCFWLCTGLPLIHVHAPCFDNPKAPIGVVLFVFGGADRIWEAH